MTNKKSDQNEFVAACRTDALITDYLDEILSSSSLHGDDLPDDDDNFSGGGEVKQPERCEPEYSGDNLAESKEPAAIDSGNRQEPFQEASEQGQSSESRSRFQHPNLKPASAILSARKAHGTKPFKSEDDKQEPVLTGLMPKFAPVTPKTETVEQLSTQQLETEPVVQQQEQVDEVVETKVDVKTEPRTDATVEVQSETNEDAETVEVSQTEVVQEPVAEVVVAEHLSVDVVEQVAVELDEQVVEQQVTEFDEPPASVPPLKTSQFRELPEFEMLLFDVRGLQLAVPLISLGSIHRLEDDFTPIVGRSDWYLGMSVIGGRNLQVVDTARWVMPSRMPADTDQPYEFLIRLADTNWALACTGVQQAMRISRDEIKWRTQQGKRPWLAGTVISKMCALLDVESMARLLDENKLEQSL